MSPTKKNDAHPRRLGLAAVAAVLIGVAVPATAQTGHNQPRMYEALNALYAARSSLESGATNKGGYRLEALAHIRQAIQDIKAGIDYAHRAADGRAPGQTGEPIMRVGLGAKVTRRHRDGTETHGAGLSVQPR